MGSGVEKRNRALGIRCYKLAEAGLTYRSIADMVGKRPEQIKGLITLGARLIDSEKQTGAAKDER